MVDHSQDDRMAESSVGQGSADDPAYTIEQALHNTILPIRLFCLDYTIINNSAYKY